MKEIIDKILNKLVKKVTKGVWRMPWLSEAMKDVISCDKPRVAENSVNPWISEWGNPAGVMSSHPKGS